MKRIAVINDLSGLGRCSLTAAISVIAAMGVQPCPVPTAVLTAQSCYPTYDCCDLTDRIDRFRSEWKKLGMSFDGICTGYMAGEHQVDLIERFIAEFRSPGTFLLVDPVMGDAGRPYDMFTPALLERMKKLITRADLITPNLTELCLLTGTDYQEIDSCRDQRKILELLTAQAADLLHAGTGRVIVTGVHILDPEDGKEKIGNLLVSRERSWFTAVPFIGKGYSGTGDLFAAVMAGGEVRGDRTEDTMELAGYMIQQAIADSVRERIPENDGVNYEPFLWMLTEKGRKQI